MQWKQGVVIYTMSCTSLLYSIIPIHCTPPPTAPPLDEYPHAAPPAAQSKADGYICYSNSNGNNNNHIDDHNNGNEHMNDNEHNNTTGSPMWSLLSRSPKLGESLLSPLGASRDALYYTVLCYDLLYDTIL